MTDLIETVTTIPLVPTDDPSPFWEGVLREGTGEQPHLAVERQGDPLWAQVLVILGGIALVGCGAFCIGIWYYS